MKRRFSKTPDANANVIEEGSFKVKKKRKSKPKDEFEFVSVKEETLSDENDDSLNDSSPIFEENQAEDIVDQLDQLSNKKKKKKKKKKLKADDDSLTETGDDEVDTTVAIKSENANGFVRVEAWPKNQILQLLDRIKEVIPENDNLKYSSRITKLDWDAISFDEYSAEECRAMWKRIQDKTRCYRLLKEVLNDAKEGVLHGNQLFGYGKMEKHPEKPAKPLSSYMLFYLDTKDKILNLHPKLSCPEQAKKVSELWKKLPPKKMEKYKMKALKLKNEYNEKLAEFYSKHPECLEEEKKKRAKVNSDSLGFEKPKSAFKLYYQSCRDNYEKKGSKLSGIEILEKVKEKWKNLPEQKKVSWIEAAQKEEEKYREMLKKYELEHPGFVLPPVKTLITKNDRHILENISGKPKKPPVNAYSLFSVLMLQGNSLKELPGKERLSEISKQWKSLSQAERDDYAKRLQEMQEQYKIQYAEYINSLPPEKRLLEEEKNRQKKRKPHHDAKITVEPEAPTTNVIELFKQKHEEEWKKNSKVSEFDQASKKWASLSSAQKEEYIDELKKINEEYLETYGKFLQHCPSDKVTQYLMKFAEHKKKLDMDMKTVKPEDSEQDSDSD